jgi:hypothetical protein
MPNHDIPRYPRLNPTTEGDIAMERTFCVEENISYDISYEQSQIDEKLAALREEDPKADELDAVRELFLDDLLHWWQYSEVHEREIHETERA